jgi:hypothetical protein
MAKTFAPAVVTQCCDCGLGCNVAGEWYAVKTKVWEEAWIGRRKSWHELPGQAVLCIGCLEQRLGRTLCVEDFTEAVVNSPDKENISERMRQRLTATESLPLNPPKRKRGRPKGSKNKPKAPAPRSRRARACGFSRGS